MKYTVLIRSEGQMKRIQDNKNIDNSEAGFLPADDYRYPASIIMENNKILNFGEVKTKITFTTLMKKYESKK